MFYTHHATEWSLQILFLLHSSFLFDFWFLIFDNNKNRVYVKTSIDDDNWKICFIPQRLSLFIEIKEYLQIQFRFQRCQTIFGNNSRQFNLIIMFFFCFSPLFRVTFVFPLIFFRVTVMSILFIEFVSGKKRNCH